MKRKQSNIERQADLTTRTQIKVRFSEVDSMKVVWHGEYVRYFEDGREAFGREWAGMGYMDIYEAGYTAPIVDLQLQYLRPLHIGESAIVETRYYASEAAKLCFGYTIFRADDGAEVARGESVQVFVDSQGELSLNSPEFYEKWKARWLSK